jgi:adenylate kinase family enzyme
MKPPELPANQQELKKAIQQYVPAQAEWVSPANEKKANKIIKEDLDQDGKNELIVFYRLPEETTQMEAIVLKKIKKKWQRIAHLKDLGRELDKVEFNDLTNDNVKEVFIGFSYSKDSPEKALTVFDIHGKKPKKLFESPYSAFFSGDFNDDDKGELLLSLLEPNQKHEVTLYHMKQKQIETIDQLKLNPYVYDYYQSRSGRISPSIKGAIFDAGMGAHSSLSFIVGVINNQLVNVIPKNMKEEDLFRASSGMSDDTNGDGILEFSLQKEANKDLPYSEMPLIDQYYQLDDDQVATMIQRSFSNRAYAYKIKIPKEWHDVEIHVSEDRRYVKLLSSEDGSLLFDVFVEDKGKQSDLQEWNVITETNQFQYLTKSSPEEWKSFFQLIS